MSTRPSSGWGWRFPGKGLRGLNTLVLNFAQPAMIIFRLQQETDPRLIMELLWGFALTCLLRLVVFPAAILLLFLTPLPPMVVKSVFVCTAMPCAALTAMQSEVFDSDRDLASRDVALSTAFSMATVPLMLMHLPA